MHHVVQPDPTAVTRHSRVIHPGRFTNRRRLRSLRPELSWHGVDNQARSVLRSFCRCYVRQCADKFDWPALSFTGDRRLLRI